MADYVPFIDSKTDLEQFAKYFHKAKMLRVGLDFAQANRRLLSSGIGNTRIWIDPTVDGFGGPEAKDERKKIGRTEDDRTANAEEEKRERKKRWVPFMSQFEGYQKILHGDRISRRDNKILTAFVDAIMDACLEWKPSWISVPQFPQANDASHNKVNRMLAESAGLWRARRKFKGRLIIPAIFTSPKQLSRRPIRKEKIGAICKSYDLSQADGIWCVDSSLMDWSGKEVFTKRQFPNLVAFHDELLGEYPAQKKPIVIAGPYWGMNLILWARGLVDLPAISMGSRFQYYVSGSIPPRGTITRTAVRELRQLIQVNAEMRGWIDAALSLRNLPSEFRSEMLALKRNLGNFLADSTAAKSHTCEVYLQWLEYLEGTPPEGRAVALYQQFSRAFVLGKQLKEFPWKKERSRIPWQVANNFMLNCL